MSQGSYVVVLCYRSRLTAFTHIARTYVHIYTYQYDIPWYISWGISNSFLIELLGSRIQSYTCSGIVVASPGKNDAYGYIYAHHVSTLTHYIHMSQNTFRPILYQKDVHTMCIMVLYPLVLIPLQQLYVFLSDWVCPADFSSLWKSFSE